MKRKGKTGKVYPCSKLFEEKKFTFQRAIAKAVSDHNVPMKLVLSLDQTPLSYVSLGKYTFDLKGSKTVPIKGVDDKRQITATFAVTASGLFLPIRLIYVAKPNVVYLSLIFLNASILSLRQISGAIMRNALAYSRR